MDIATQIAALAVVSFFCFFQIIICFLNCDRNQSEAAED